METNQTFDLLCQYAPTISVGILTADLMNLSEELALLDQTEVKIIHFDVMDGCFVPKMTVGPPFVKAVKTDLLKDVHLMIQDPLEKVEEFVKAGADMITVHVDSSEDILPVLKELGDMENSNDCNRGLVRGIALNPDIPINRLDPLLDYVEMVSVLAVNPRIKGMPYCEDFVNRCNGIRNKLNSKERRILVCIDGGVKLTNIKEIAEIRADLVVSGSAIYDGKAVVENVQFMLSEIRKGKYGEV